MDGLFTLLSLGLVMAVASFVVGSLPLSLSLSPPQLRLVSALGMGVLIGTSLIVIIPEGVETLYSSTSLGSQHHHNSLGRRLAGRGLGIDARWDHVPEQLFVLPRGAQENSGELHPRGPRGADDSAYPEYAGDSHKEDHGKKEDHSGGEQQIGSPDDHDGEGSPHAWIGVGLISGFILMYLIDQLPQFAARTSGQQQRPYHISLDNLALSGLGRGGSPARSGLLDFSSAGGGSSRSPGFSTTMGLVIHAAADGIALGASSSNTSLSLIIFFAIMVHKAPASFGLTSVLLKQGLSTRAARAHLLVFSLAAPVGAIVTWILAHTIFAGLPGDEQASRWRTGMLLLFSAGTFLFVAIHTMQESNTDRRDSSSNGYHEGRDAPPPPKKSMRDLVASVIGMIIPLFLQIGHAH